MFRLTALTLLTIASLFGCGPERYSWNQRMTVTVETPDGIVNGSSVVEVNATYCPDGCVLAGDSIGSYNYRGEAVAVEVLPDRWLFALIGEPGELIYHARPDLFGGIRRSDRGQWARLIPDVTGAVELTRGLRPRFVTFADITVPASVEAVDADNLAATFGEGVRIVEVTLEVVRDESTTEFIAQVLPWLPAFYGRQLDGNSYRDLRGQPSAETMLSTADFWSGS